MFCRLFSRSKLKNSTILFYERLTAVLNHTVGLRRICANKVKLVLKLTYRQLHPLQHRLQNRTVFPDKFIEGGSSVEQIRRVFGGT